MKFGRLINTIYFALLLVYSSVINATESEHSVVIEVITNGMSADKVEESIANPIEILMSNLTDVLLISAKYQENEAEITVKFNQAAAEQAGLVDRVRKVLDENMSKLPENIVTMYQRVPMWEVTSEVFRVQMSYYQSLQHSLKKVISLRRQLVVIS